ncbi:MAG: cell division ATP-binding protein FtsE [Candidatus Nomurabacteria bacterium]|nr:cell division ATP-binding protein FtsE [Candidatus Nomurabacteria bacterium]
MIFFNRVSKFYPKKLKPVLDNVTLNIAPGEFVVIMGQSGAGKSTILKLITREEKPSAGKIVVGGIDYDDLRPRDIPLLRRRIGVVFQDYKLLPHRTVFENVAFAMEISGMTDEEIQFNVPKILELVGLDDKANEFPDALSGGEKQRVAIARAMVRQPKILIADEPTANLDEKTSLEIVKLLVKINRYGTTVMMISHDINIVKKLRHRVIHIEHGRIIKETKPRSKNANK